MEACSLLQDEDEIGDFEVDMTLFIVNSCGARVVFLQAHHGQQIQPLAVKRATSNQTRANSSTLTQALISKVLSLAS